MMLAARNGSRAARICGSMLALLLGLAACLASVAHAADGTRAASSVQPVAGPPSVTGAQPATGMQAGNDAESNSGAAVLESFDKQQVQRVKQASELSDHSKRMIMFVLAIPLFILLLITGGLGIATGVYGKKLFIQHMFFAGLTITLALAHAIAGLVWFYPF